MRQKGWAQRQPEADHRAPGEPRHEYREAARAAVSHFGDRHPPGSTPPEDVLSWRDLVKCYTAFPGTALLVKASAGISPSRGEGGGDRRNGDTAARAHARFDTRDGA